MELALVVLVALTFTTVVFSAIFILVKKIWGEKIIKTLNNIKFKKKTTRVNIQEMLSFVSNLTSTLSRMSTDKIGALIVVQNRDSLNKYIEGGNRVDAPFFPEFVYTVFYNHESPLHDGAIIINNQRIASISSYLPISKRVLDVKYGARHRAAFGITEISDATAFVVSETTGKITCMYLDNIYSLSSVPSKLANEIIKIFGNVGILVDKDNYTTFDDINATAKASKEAIVEKSN